MKRTVGGYRAHLYEYLEAPKTGPNEPFLNRELYSVEGIPGLWRRVKAPDGQENAESVGVIAAWYVSRVVWLCPAVAQNKELAEGGYAPVSGLYSEAAVGTLVDLTIACGSDGDADPPGAPPEQPEAAAPPEPVPAVVGEPDF